MAELVGRMKTSDEDEVDERGIPIVWMVGNRIEKNQADGRPPLVGVITELRPVPGEPDLMDVYVTWTGDN
jgi:hypothetical protein